MIEGSELERNGSRDSGSDGRSRGTSRIGGLRLLDQYLEIAQIDAQLVREPKRWELAGGDEPVDGEAAPKPEVGCRLLRR
jgi:hypothetical protein